MNGSVQINCPHCGKMYSFSADKLAQSAGRTLRCTNCQQSFTLPAVGGVEPSGSAAALGPEMPPPPPRPVQYQSPQTMQERRGNPMAIAALICSLLFCIPVLPSLLAIIFGAIGLKRAKEPGAGGQGMALTGLILGIVGFVVFPCMVSILLPSLNRARETANRVKCASNMRQIGQAMLLYANDNRGKYPQRLEDMLISGDLTDPIVFVCPSGDRTPAPGATPTAQAQAISGGGPHMAYVYVAGRMTTSASPDAILLYEDLTSHTDGINVLFGDGHVEFFTKATSEQIIKDLKAGQNPPSVMKKFSGGR